MLDIKTIRDNPKLVSEACIDKGEPDVVERLLALDEKRRGLQAEGDRLRHLQKEQSSKIGEAYKSGDMEAVAGLKESAKELSGRIKSVEDETRAMEKECERSLLSVPNLPASDVPVGGEDACVIVRRWGEIPRFDFETRDHLELGDILGIIDMERGAKVAGRAFPMLIGDGARMSRALVSFMLDVHRADGFIEIAPPYLANRAAMTGSAQIPKLEDDMYRVERDDLFLIPTSEVPVTNYHAREILNEDVLPLYYTAYSANFRREAGSYGADTRGLLRVHQFDKVELVKFVRPEDSPAEHESLLAQAEKILRALEVPYRVKLLATKDMSFAASKVFDLEIWAPAEGRWLEVSSCSSFMDFQARRANIRYRPADGGALRFVHTLNSSGVALPRLLVSLWELGQTRRATIELPRGLWPYMAGQREIIPRI